MHITTALIMIPSEFPKPWMFKFHSPEFNTELTEIQQSTNLDSINDYIWEEPAWKAQAFGVLPTTLPSTGYRKKKQDKTKRNPRLHIYFCMNSLVEDSKNLDKILKKKNIFSSFSTYLHLECFLSVGRRFWLERSSEYINLTWCEDKDFAERRLERRKSKRCKRKQIKLMAMKKDPRKLRC